MKRSAQNTLYHLLPVAFWLLALGGIVVWELLTNYQSPITNYIPALLALLSGAIIRRIPRHEESVEQCFVVALLLGVAAYWLPSVVFLLLPVWAYLIYRNIFSFRSFLASVLGLALVAVWYAVLHLLNILSFPLYINHNAGAWVPTASVIIAWILTLIVRQTLRVR